MARVLHFDRLSLRFDASTLRPQADGSRFVDGVGAHVGNYTYHDDKGQPFVEHVPASTLFSQASLDSAAGSVLTIRHGPGLVTPDRYRQESHGSWVKAWDAGGGNLGVRLRLGSSEAIEFVDQAIADKVSVELSPVYEVDVVGGRGSTEFGTHDATQDGRMYSGIALLGPDEARGGPGTRLQLDGPECAPAGTRIQVARASLDSKPRKPLHSDTESRNTMSKAIICSDGRKPRTITGAQLVDLRAVRVKGDQIETGKVTIEIEGEETSELVLPKSMIDLLLEGIGASSAPAPELSEPIEEEAMIEAAGLDADDDEKADSKLATKVAAEVKRQVKLSLDARDVISARRVSVNADALRCLPTGYDFSGTVWQQWALDSIVRKSPADEALAAKLSRDSKKGDTESSGMLRMLLTRVASSVTSDSASSTISPGGPSTTGSESLTGKADAADDWSSPTKPPREKMQ